MIKGKMKNNSKRQYQTIEEYIEQFPGNIRKKLEKFRQTIRKAAPDASEAISYQIPTFKLNGNLVHFAAFKDHISFFPASSGIAAFKKELGIYRTSKGTVRFPVDAPIPYTLISRIVKYRVKENLKKEKI